MPISGWTTSGTTRCWLSAARWSTPLGSVWQEMTYDAGGVGSEHIRKHYIAGREDYRVLAYLVEHSVLRRNEEAIRARQGDLGV